MITYTFAGLALLGCCKMARDLLGYSKKQARIDAGLWVERVSCAIFDN